MSNATQFRETPRAETLPDEKRSSGRLFVTVIMPVRNEAAHILATLGELVAQDYASDRFEILVVDGESEDGTPDLVENVAKDHPNVRLLHNPKRLSSAARNVGIREAKGDVVVVIDGHCEIGNPRYIANVAEAFEETGADVLGRPQPLDVTNATPLQRAVAAARNSRLGHHPESFIYSDKPQRVPAKSVGVAYRRHVFDKVGLFDETFDAHEDGEFNYRCDRAGLVCYFTPDIAVRYHPRGSLTGLFRQMVRYGRGRVRLFRKHPETFELGTLIPMVFLLGLTLGPLACLAVPICSYPYLGCLALYGSLTAFVGLTAAATHRHPLVGMYVPVVSLTVHTGAGWGGLVEMVRVWRRKTEPQSGGCRSDASHGPRVLLIAASLRIMGGQAVMAHRLITDLRHDGKNVTFLPIDPLLPRLLQPLRRIKYVRTLINWPFYWGTLLREIPRHDVIHVFSASYFSFLISPAPAVVVSRLFRRPCVLNYHSGEAEDHLARIGWFSKWLLSLPERIVVQSAYLVSVFERFGFAATAIPNHVDTASVTFRERKQLSPKILVARALEPLYNIPCAIKAFRIVKERYPNARMTVLGDGSQRESLEQFAKNEGVSDVTFTGRVERDDIARYFDEHDIFLNTSSIDNMPVSILEAFAAGMPVVSTSAGGIPTMVTHGVTGCLVDLDDDESAAGCILELLEDAQYAGRIIQAERDEIKKFQWGVVGRQWESLYQGLSCGQLQ